MKVCEGKNGMKCRSEGADEPMTNPTIRPGMGLSNFVGNQEPPGLPQEACVTDPPPLDKKGNYNMNKHLAPQAPSLVESYPPITLVLICLVANNVFIINYDRKHYMSWEHWPFNNCLGTLASQNCNNTLFKMGV